MDKVNLLQKIKGGLIVSCQALEDEPLHSPFIMSRMALAAKEGGAAGIRANGADDIAEIKKLVDLPIIGIIKKNYEDSEVYITPTLDEVDLLYRAGVEVIATDATRRPRPNGKSLEEFVRAVRAKYPDVLLLADCSNVEEGLHAQELGFDMVGTTLCSYTAYTRSASIPNFEMIRTLSQKLTVPVVAEGGIWSPEQLAKVYESGAYVAVVGSAITRPLEIVRHFVRYLPR